MCKHVAAALYGVGARLDEKPQLLFVLRGVDENELLAGAGDGLALKTAPGAAKVLEDRDVAALFGLEMVETANSQSATPTAPKRQRRSKSQKASKTPAVKTAAAAKKSNRRRATRTRSEPGLATSASARKGRAQRRRPLRPT